MALFHLIRHIRKSLFLCMIKQNYIQYEKGTPEGTYC